METLFDLPTEATMSTELVEHHAEPTPMLLVQQLIASGRDPGEMLTIYERWESNLAADAYGVALTKFQAACPQIVKRRQIDLGGGKGPLYASLDDIMLTVKPLLAECGLAVTFSAAMTAAGQLTAKCFIHCGRHIEASEITLPVPSQMRVNDTQKVAAALSYAKRYAFCAALNIIVTDEDRDANGMVQTIDEKQIATIIEWVESTGTDLKRFLNWLALEKLSDMSAEQFPVALRELQRKAAKK